VRAVARGAACRCVLSEGQNSEALFAKKVMAHSSTLRSLCEFGPRYLLELLTAVGLIWCCEQWSSSCLPKAIRACAPPCLGPESVESDRIWRMRAALPQPGAAIEGLDEAFLGAALARPPQPRPAGDQGLEEAFRCAARARPRLAAPGRRARCRLHAAATAARRAFKRARERLSKRWLAQAARHNAEAAMREDQLFAQKRSFGLGWEFSAVAPAAVVGSRGGIGGAVGHRRSERTTSLARGRSRLWLPAGVAGGVDAGASYSPPPCSGWPSR